MPKLMRCLYCGLLQDEPQGVKTCSRCGGELSFEKEGLPGERGYVQVWMELDQVAAPAGRNVDRHLLVTIKTPAQVPPEEAAPPGAGRPALCFVAALDVSGSMRGAKIEQAKEGVRQALHRLHDGDTFSLVLFSSQVRCILEPTEVTSDTRRVVESVLEEVQAGGMTALDGGLEQSISRALSARRDTNLVLLLSDGQANVGEKDVEKVGYRGLQARQQGLIVSTLGVGGDYNEALMAEIATQGGGRFYHVQDAAQIGVYLDGELGEVVALAAREAALHLTIPSGSAVFPLSAAYPATQGEGRASVLVGDIPSDVELEIPIRITLPAQPPDGRLSVEGELTYRSPAGSHLTVPLNRVTVRFKAPDLFGKRDGVVAPVVERVLDQLRAASVLNVSRAMAKAPAEGERQAEDRVTTLREYASLLGEERAEEEASRIAADLKRMRSAPARAKQAVAAAFAVQRAAKKFDE